MADKFDYSKTKVMLAEPNGQLRREVASILRREGFEKLEQATEIDDIRAAIKGDHVDCLIADTQVPQGELNDLIHELRHQRAGENPFLVTITTLSAPSGHSVAEAIDSGTDTIIAKPFAIKDLLGRLAALTRARKHFVVTTDYTGPDRRGGNRDDDSMVIPTFPVPNPMNLWATGRMDESAYRRAVQQTAAVLNQEKVERHAFQIGFLVDRIVPGIQKGVVDTQLRIDLEKLVSVATDIAERMTTTPQASAAETCRTLATMAAKLRDRDELAAAPEDLARLSHLTRAVTNLFASAATEGTTSA